MIEFYSAKSPGIEPSVSMPLLNLWPLASRGFSSSGRGAVAFVVCELPEVCRVRVEFHVAQSFRDSDSLSDNLAPRLIQRYDPRCEFVVVYAIVSLEGIVQSDAFIFRKPSRSICGAA